ncbi:4-(cytidine 5'-diphospho)-2-C-methyl-D-erythritol kinase [Gracilinema caldarium]|uniref:4-diphosphocytidyl-2-C-methyl-D-erythritol kinase n=1 Tax=Gracilinema caldarium (strain ATCC 51460 / DSM 7334 / H1) TaxID=744872 RepID=F8F080_GRAC1|nr:4-(cytidine 5'-diphospho)-2-C-methyl-D-erythritol kinase [Gracilinema caldarium]AEJ18944.1 4-diphosphocytidyl-2-C-methyl-D-erythritolkinase [Gracilinema caldarium DSM 7334]
MGDGIRVAAPCKINLHLGIFDRRSDGYHPIESIFQMLDFGDTIWIESLKKSSGIELHMEGSVPMKDVVPPEQNSIYTAVRLFQMESGCESGWYIRLNKHIPLGAGLGGGSADAAAVLLALNQICGKPFSDISLEHFAAKLGSDVPFFIKGGTAYVTGRGERISPISVTTSWAVLLVNPGIHSSTPEAFRLLDTVRSETRVCTKPLLGRDVLVRLLESHPQHWTFYNDFLEVFLKHGTLEVQQTYQAILRELREAGADFVNLSGSGSTCFGVFADHDKARKTLQNMKGRWPLVELTFPLARKVNPVVE